MPLLLVENSTNIELLTENVNGSKKYMIEGVFAQANKINGNKRFYNRDILVSAINTYKTDYIDQKRATGELNHPDRPFPDIKEAAIFIESLEWHGDDVIGRATVLDTPNGLIVRSLMDAGFKMGVSTRALGDVTKKDGVSYVNEGLLLTAVDCVDKPSGPDCYVNKLKESIWENINESWVKVSKTQKIDESKVLEQIDKFMHKLRNK